MVALYCIFRGFGGAAEDRATTSIWFIPVSFPPPPPGGEGDSREVLTDQCPVSQGTSAITALGGSHVLCSVLICLVSSLLPFSQDYQVAEMCLVLCGAGGSGVFETNPVLPTVPDKDPEGW